MYKDKPECKVYCKKQGDNLVESNICCFHCYIKDNCNDICTDKSCANYVNEVNK